MNRNIGDVLQHLPHELSVDQALLANCLAALQECASVCNICADACPHERQVHELRSCIALNHDCVAVCLATAQLLGRQGSMSAELLSGQLRACASTCYACSQECSRHAAHMEHCRICADVCRECANACEQLLDAVQG